MADEFDLIPTEQSPASEPIAEPVPTSEAAPEADALVGRVARRTAESEPEAEKPRKAAPKPTALGSVMEMIEVVVGALVAAIVVLTLVCRTGVVDGGSMLPTMTDGDRYIISDLFYTPEQGDIVVFRPGIEGKEELWIKRVIAVEGQEVYIDVETSKVYVDGEELYEPYLSPYTGTTTSSKNNPVVVPEGHVFVMGDNRMISHDSRSDDLGCVSVDLLAGRVLLRFWPFEDFEFYG